VRFIIDEFVEALCSLESGKIPPIILVNGNEPLLIEEMLDQAREALKKVGFSERITYQLDAAFEWSNVTNVGMEMSLFSERRIIELRVPKSLGVAGTKAISEYCQKPSEQDLLLVIMPSLDKRQRQAKWLKSIDACGWVVDCFEVSQQQFPNWVKKRLQTRSLRVENGVLELLVEYLEGNVLAAAQEIDKLKVLAKDGAVTHELVSASLADQARFDVYALTDVCLQGNLSRALRIKQRLQTEGIEPVIVVWALVKEVRVLAELSANLSAGGNKGMLFKQHRIWSKREPLVNSALQRIDSEQWLQILENAAYLDQTVKGQRTSEPGSVWHQIEKLCASICGVEAVKQVRLMQ